MCLVCDKCELVWKNGYVRNTGLGSGQQHPSIFVYLRFLQEVYMPLTCTEKSDLTIKMTTNKVTTNSWFKFFYQVLLFLKMLTLLYFIRKNRGNSDDNLK